MIKKGIIFKKSNNKVKILKIEKSNNIKKQHEKFNIKNDKNNSDDEMFKNKDFLCS